MQYPVSIKYSAELETLEATFNLNAILLSNIAVTTPPTKTTYRDGETISYTGLVVTATYSDNSTSDVTSSCTFSPVAGKTFDSISDTSVTITYREGLTEKTTSLNLNVVLLSSIAVTTPPTKTTYRDGETISYTGLVVTATYSDNSTSDVTSSCTFSPVAGKVFNSNTDTSVTITYREGLTEKTTSLTLEAESVSTLLRITTPPNKTAYTVGESLDYTGIVVSAIYEDGTQHDVTSYCDFSPAQGATVTSELNQATITCAPPLEPYVYDYAKGYVDAGVWKYQNPTNTRVDIYRVLNGHTYWVTLGKTVGSRFRAMFTTTDVTQLTSNVTGTTIINTNNPAAYASKIYTPTADGYIIVAKDNTYTDGLMSYLYDANAQKTESITLSLAVGSPVSIAVTTNPTKMAYINGEEISYAGMVVTGRYSNGGAADVTSLCTISPAAGKIFDSATDTNVSITLNGLSASLTLAVKTLTGIQVASYPSRTAYKAGDIISYAGLAVNAVYSDSSTSDVTSDCSIAPPAGKAFDSSTDTHPVISYQGYQAGLTLSLDTSSMTLQITSNPTKTSYMSDEALDYTGLAVKAVYDDETETDVTNQCVITPSAGSPFEEYIDIAYNGAHATLELTRIYVRSLLVNPPTKLIYSEGEALNFTGLSVKAFYSNADSSIVTSQCRLSQSEGRPFDINNKYVWVHYEDAVDYFVLRPLANTANPIYVAEMPTKTSYDVGDSADYAGVLVKMRHADGTEHDVTDLCSFSPAQGSTLAATNSSVTVSCASPLTPYIYDMHQGGVDGEEWLGDQTYYTDLYQVQSGVTYTLMSDGNGLFQAAFSPYDLSTITSEITCENIADLAASDLDSVYTYTPAENGYIAFTKHESTSGLKSYVFSSASTKTETATFDIDVARLYTQGTPNKTLYNAHELIDYTGVSVYYVNNDGTSTDVTSYATFTPAQGSVFKTDITGVFVSYNGREIFEPDIKLCSNTVRQLKLVRKPNKWEYYYGDVVDYTGMKITAVYGDGSEVDVTEFVTMYPTEGSVITAETYFRASCNGKSAQLSFTRADSIAFNSVVKVKKWYWKNIYLATVDYKEVKSWISLQDPYNIEKPVTYIKLPADYDYTGKYISPYGVDRAEYDSIAREEIVCRGINPEDGRIIDDIEYVDFEPRYEHFWDVITAGRGSLDNYGFPKPYEGEKYIFKTEGNNVVASYDIPGFTRRFNAIYERMQAISTFEADAFINGLDLHFWNLFDPYVVPLAGKIPSKEYRVVDEFFEYDQWLEKDGVTLYGRPKYYREDETVVYDGLGTVVPQNFFYLVKLFDINDDDNEYNVFFNVRMNLNIIVSRMLSSLSVFGTEGRYFFIGETINFTVYASYNNGTSEDVTSACVFSSTVATAKASQSMEGAPISVSYRNPRGETMTKTVSYKVTRPQTLNITNPTKMAYYEGELLNLAGLSVIAGFYERDETLDVTSEATYTIDNNEVQNGSPVYGSSLSAVYTYNGYNVSKQINFTFATLQGITITLPGGATYRTGDTMYYTNMQVVANYSDGSTRDVTSGVICSPANGSVATTTAATVTVSYTVGTKTVTSSFSQTIIALSSLRISQAPYKTTYKVGETLDYSGLEARAVYADGHETGVSHLCECSPAEGSIVTNDTTQITVQYQHNSGELIMNTVALNVIQLTGLIISDPTVYNLGDTVDYSTVTVLASYSDGSSEDVTSAVSYSQSDGITVTKNTNKNVTVTYTKAAGVSISDTMLLKIQIIDRLIVTAPTKTSYVIGETLDFTGLSVVCRYTDGTTATVTSQVSLSHTNGAKVDSSTATEVVITYTESGETVTGSFGIAIS